VSTDFIWWSATALEGVVLSRGVATGLVRRYSLFYVYIGCTLLSDILRVCCYQFAPSFYPEVYWHTELATVIANYAVVIEIFRQSLRHNPGVAHFTRRLLSVVCVVVFTYASLDLWQHGFASLPRATADVGRYLRYVEGALLPIMLWLFTRYRIPLGRNLLGLTLGNAFWISLNVVNFAFWSEPGNESSFVLRTLRPASYLITVAVWCIALWSVQADPVRPAESEIERDYEVLAAKTRAILARTSNRFVKVMRP